MEIKDDAPSYISTRYYSTCLDRQATDANATKKCEGLKTGDSVTFELEFSVDRCPSNQSEWQKVVKIFPAGANESIEVDISLLCQCDCETVQAVGVSAKCHNGGAIQCGICQCDEKHLGANCECLM